MVIFPINGTGCDNNLKTYNYKIFDWQLRTNPKNQITKVVSQGFT